MDFAAAEVERDLVGGVERAERLGQALDLQGWAQSCERLPATRPMIPPRAKSTTSSKQDPSRNCQYSVTPPSSMLEQDEEHRPGHRTEKPADTAEDDEHMISPDRCQLNIDGLTKRLRSAKSAPARPVIAAEMTKAISRTSKGRMPTAGQPRRVLPRAMSSASPKRERTIISDSAEHSQQQPVDDQEEGPAGPWSCRPNRPLRT